MNSDPYQIRQALVTGNGTYDYFSLAALQTKGYDIGALPFSIRVLLENALRNYDGFAVTAEHISGLLDWGSGSTALEIPFKPARVLMQDFTGVPAVVDIASLRAELVRKGKDPARINPLVPVDLVVDHSVQVDYYGTSYAYEMNIAGEYERNTERYQFLKWAQNAFDNFSVVPPGMGICHQVNLEYLAKGVIEREGLVFPDTLVGTDSHTPMVNGIGVIGWGVGGIEAEAAMLGQPVYFIIPEVIGLELTGKLPAGSTGTDLVLTITELLRTRGVIGKFVEVFGSALDELSVPDRASIGNMSPEFGCTVTYFPVDEKTLEYMRKSDRSEQQVQLVEQYCKANLLWRTGSEKIAYTQVVKLDLTTVEQTVSGPKRPQDKILLKNFKSTFITLLEENYGRKYIPQPDSISRWKGEGGSQPLVSVPAELPETIVEVANHDAQKEIWITTGQQKLRLSDGSIVIAAITSCTNTSNPYVMLGAGLVARKARERGINVKPWVKTSLAPGSKVVTDYLRRAELLADLEALNFHIVGYGCTTCIGNSGPLPPHISKPIDEEGLVVAAVLSGNRNFEARIHPQVRMNFLMSPMLVVAYAIAGRVDIDLLNEPVDFDTNQRPVFLKDIWPTQEEISVLMSKVLLKEDFSSNYATILDGNGIWRGLAVSAEKLYNWDHSSTYIREAPFFRDLPLIPAALKDVTSARVLLYLGDSVTTDHISPAGSFSEFSAAGLYLNSLGVVKENFNSYGSRRGNDEVMIRGTFANVRLKNKLARTEGGYTQILPAGQELTVYEAAMEYRKTGTPLIVLAGKEYGSGSSRDWAAKGTFLLGIRIVIAESYERIHRSNLVGMGVLPLQFLPGQTADSLGLTGLEIFDFEGIESVYPNKQVSVTATDPAGKVKVFDVVARLDSLVEIEYYRNGGILQYVLRQFLKEI
ncbi:aconitate hydratase AcnA [Mucilaginibacter sp.]|uniref:aconitate hydratase AcnA n=1 Tax=Mucilaginibacter sp. TaxID=1882438 RepID=UPI0035BBD279